MGRNPQKERKKLDTGQIISSEKDQYKIEGILGSGGFGDVYKVGSLKTPNGPKYAMKTEYFDPMKRKLLNRLKIEMGVFTQIQRAPPLRRKHFITMLDKGLTELFKFIVMEIVSYSLEDIRKYMLNTVVSLSTSIRVAIQTLQSISDFHSIGYIHRDIKPHNFAIGCPPNDSMIYMLDFGIARRYREKDGKLRIPRQTVAFLGTVKFASRSCHQQKEQSRRDDIEVWIYMILELFDQENILWRTHRDKENVIMLKERIFSSTDDLNLKMPPPFIKIINYVKNLNFADNPDYDLITNTLFDCARTLNIDMLQPLDWIDKPMPPKPEKKPPKKEEKEVDDNMAEKRKKRDKRRSHSKDNDEMDKEKKDEKKKEKDVESKGLEGEDDDDDDDGDDEKPNEGGPKKTMDQSLFKTGDGGGKQSSLVKTRTKKGTEKTLISKSIEGVMSKGIRAKQAKGKQSRTSSNEMKPSVAATLKPPLPQQNERKDRSSYGNK